MTIISGSFEKARHYIEAHAKDAKQKNTPHASITFSRQTGAGADVVSDRLVEVLKPYQKEGSVEWTVFDKNLIEKILSDHNLPGHLARFFEEHKQTSIQSFTNEIFLGYSAFDVIKRTAQTILQLVNKGNVIIIGRGATAITAGLRQVFHVRLVAPFEKRVEHVMEVYQLSKNEAVEFTKKEDIARENFFHRYYQKDINDPLLYDLIINTGTISYYEAAHLVKDAVVKRYGENL